MKRIHQHPSESTNFHPFARFSGIFARGYPALLCALLLDAGVLRLPAQAVQAPVKVPAESTVEANAANLALRKDLDRRYQKLQQTFQKWNTQATAYNDIYGERKFKEGSKEARAGVAEQTRLMKLLGSYQGDLKTFNTDLARLRLKTTPSATDAINQPAMTKGSEIINAMNAMARRLGWDEKERTRLDRTLRALGYLRSTAEPTLIRQTWNDILSRGPESEFAREAANGGGPGFPGAGKQTRYEDCVIFALANAAGLPYGVVAARAATMIRDGTWRSGIHRADPEQGIKDGLNGGEVVLLAEAFGQAEVVADADLAKTLKGGRPVLVDVVPSGGSGKHQVLLTKTFQHAGDTWFEMMESYQGPQRRLYVSAAELKLMQLENAVAFEPDAKKTPRLLRAEGAE